MRSESARFSSAIASSPPSPSAGVAFLPCPAAKMNVLVSCSMPRRLSPLCPVMYPIVDLGAATTVTSSRASTSTSMGSFVRWRMSHSMYSRACFRSRSSPAKIATSPTYSMIAPDAAASFLRVLPRLPSAYENSSPRKGKVS